MNKFISVLLAVFSAIVLVSCNSKEPVSMTYVEQDRILYPDLEVTHDFSEVWDSVRQKHDVQSFIEKYQVQYYKTVNSVDYTVIKTNEGFCVVFFGRDDIVSNIKIVVFSDTENKNKLESLSVGSTLGDAQTADPTGQYDFLSASWSGYPQISYHYFSDGDCYAIEYSDGKISNITLFTL